MNKLSNFFVKLGNGIKKGFFGLINWVKTTAWIQPLLIVGIIFGVILSIKPVTSWVGGLFNPDETYEFYNQNKTDIKNFVNEETGEVSIDDNGTVILFFYNEVSSKCGTIEKTIRNFAASNPSIRWYCINTDLDDEDEDENGKTEQWYFNDCFQRYFEDHFIAGYDIIVRNYNGMISEAHPDELDFGSVEAFEIPVPMMARYDNGQLIGVRPDVSESKTYDDIENFVIGNPETDWVNFKLD